MTYFSAGQSWHVLELHPGKVVVRRHSNPGGVPVFSPVPRHGHFDYLLPPEASRLKHIHSVPRRMTPEHC